MTSKIANQECLGFPTSPQGALAMSGSEGAIVPALAAGAGGQPVLKTELEPNRRDAYATFDERAG